MKTKIKMLLLLLMCLVSADACKRNGPTENCSSGESDMILFKFFSRITDAVIGFIPGGSFISVIKGMALDVILEDIGGGISVNEIILCHLSNYANDKLWNLYGVYKDRILLAIQLNDTKSLQNTRKGMESSEALAGLVVDQDYLKSAVWPVLFPIALLHLKLYQRLMVLDGSKRDQYADKHDEYVEFYAKLILRYWKPFREKLMKDRYDLCINLDILLKEACNK